MKAAFIPYIIFLPRSPVGREGSEFWNKAAGTHWEEEEATIGKNASVVSNWSFPPRSSRCSRTRSSSYGIKWVRAGKVCSWGLSVVCHASAWSVLDKNSLYFIYYVHSFKKPFASRFSVVHFSKQAAINSCVLSTVKSTGSAAPLWPWALEEVTEWQELGGTRSVSSYMQPRTVKAGIETGVMWRTHMPKNKPSSSEGGGVAQ